MIWNSASEFLAMGGYGLYVWGSFGVTALAIVGEIWLVGVRHKAIQALVAQSAADNLGDRA